MSNFQRVGYNQKPHWNHRASHQGPYLQNRYVTKPSWTTPSLEFEYKFWCETCDKGFKTHGHLEYHKKFHQKCNIDGCQYIAHPAVITKHIQMQHATGLFQRIGRLNNPEEIRKWREDRKRKYPTKANIEKKQAEIKEKIKRGEKLGINQRKGGFNKDKQAQQNKGRHKNAHPKYQKEINNRKRKSSFSDRPQPVKKTCNFIPPIDDNTKLQPFKGIQDLIYEETTEEPIAQPESDLIEDDDEPIIENKIISEPTLCGAITSLICNYGSSDEDEDIDTFSNNKTNINNENKDADTKANDKICNSDIEINDKTLDKTSFSNKLQNGLDNLENIKNHESDSGPEEKSIDKENSSYNDMKVPIPKIKRDKLKNKKPYKKIINLRRKLPSTLLEKLLHKEIQHERNVILQCVRYVVEHKYFDKIE